MNDDFGPILIIITIIATPFVCLAIYNGVDANHYEEAFGKKPAWTHEFVKLYAKDNPALEGESGVDHYKRLRKKLRAEVDAKVVKAEKRRAQKKSKPATKPARVMKVKPSPPPVIIQEEKKLTPKGVKDPNSYFSVIDLSADKDAVRE